MSTLNVSNITDGTNSVETVYVARGSAKAWASVNGTGTIAVRDSANVSSLTDIASGVFDTNFSNAYGAADYTISGSTVGNTTYYSWIVTAVVAPTASSFRTATGRFDLTSGNIVDQNYVSVITHGDLA